MIDTFIFIEPDISS